jgi:hypothetical protein
LVLFLEQLPKRGALNKGVDVGSERLLSKAGAPIVDDGARHLLLHRRPGVMDDRAAVAHQHPLEAFELARIERLGRPRQLQDGLSLHLGAGLRIVIAGVRLDDHEREQHGVSGAQKLEGFIVRPHLFREAFVPRAAPPHPQERDASRGHADHGHGHHEQAHSAIPAEESLASLQPVRAGHDASTRPTSRLCRVLSRS